jgi:RNA polymerase sigma factor (sigma-70 family)
MEANDWLARRFDENRARLRAVAYRMLGSASEAEDALQETWFKLSRSGSQEVENLGGWLTTALARVCLDMLRTRRSRREEPLAAAADTPAGGSPEDDLALADSVGPALSIVLDTLAPAERVAFVLHDMFNLPFEEIARILDRTPVAVRQLASRARRRVQGVDRPAADISLHRELVNAFLAASRDGDFERLVAVLSPEAVLRVDEPAVRASAARREQGAPELAPEIRGAATIAGTFKGRARGATPALIDGQPGAVWTLAGVVRAAFLFSIEHGRITAIEIIADQERLAGLEVTMA